MTRMVMSVDKVSETVALTNQPSYQQSSVYSLVEVCDNRRHKQEVKLRPVLVPVKYSDTAYVYINSTRKRYVSRTYYEPRIRPKSFADTTYVCPKTTEHTFVSIVDSHADQTKSWFKTSVEIKPRNFKSSFCHPSSTNTSVAVSSPKTGSDVTTNRIYQNGGDSLSNRYNSDSYFMEEVDENMNRKIQSAFKEKYDPGASQVFIPKRKEGQHVNDVILDQIKDQILIDYDSKDRNGASGLCNGYASLNGHRSDVSDL